MPYLVRNLIAPSLIEDIRLNMLKLKLFIRSIYRKFSNSHDMIEWLLLAIGSILCAFVVLLSSISVSDYLYGKETTDIFLTILRSLIIELALVAFLQISPIAWYILGVSWLATLYFFYDSEDDEDKPNR